MLDAYVHCAALVRDTDKDRFLSRLFAPAAARPHLHALDAFAIEVARVREVVREPFAGEIRLQWWRDVVAGAARGEVAASPVAAALRDTVERCGLPREPLLELIAAHALDLYDDARASLADLDAQARRIEGTGFALAATILGGAAAGAACADAAAAAGIAHGLVRQLHSFPREVARGHIFVPDDVLRRHGVTREEIAARNDGAGLRAALTELRDHAGAAFARFRAAVPAVPEGCAPAFLEMALVPQLSARLAAAAPFTPVEVPQWRRQWTLWRAARRWPTI